MNDATPASPVLPAHPAEDGGVGLRLPRLRRPLHLGGRDGRGPARAEGPALPGPGEARHLPVHGRGPVARRYLRLQAEALEPTTASRSARGGRRRQAARLAVEVQAARPERPVDLRAVPRGRQARRRPVPGQQHADRPAEPPAGVPPAAHRHLPVPPAVAGRLGALRPGHREREPARLHHALPAGQQRRRRRTTAARSCRRSTRARASATTSSRSRRPRSATSPIPKRSVADQRKQLDFVQTLNRETPGARPGEPGRRRGDRVVRAGLPDAGRAAAR